jgi:uncharacterized lipoprotein YehR (DUF1307 family)
VRGLALVATAIALTGSVAACGDDDDGPTTPANIAGTYTLQTINGTPLPFTIGGGVIVQSSTLTLDQALGFLVRVVGTANGAPGGFDDNGIYARSNNSLQFTSTNFDDFTGTVSGRTVTIQYDYGDGVVRTAVYTR